MVEEWTWEEIRGWIDEEGTIQGVVIPVKKDKTYLNRYIRVWIYQKDRRPLDSMREWVKRQGKPCSVYAKRIEGRIIHSAILDHHKRNPLPALKGLKHPKKIEQLERARKRLG